MRFFWSFLGIQYGSASLIIPAELFEELTMFQQLQEAMHVNSELESLFLVDLELVPKRLEAGYIHHAMNGTVMCDDACTFCSIIY